MNKKPFILISSLLLLSGCATYNEITEPKQAREKLQQIETSQKDFSLKNITLSSTLKTSTNNVSKEVRTEIAISVESKYIVATLYTKGEENGVVTESTTKSYSYIQDSYYYFAIEASSGETTTKSYSKYEVDATKVDRIFDELELDIEDIEETIKGSEYLATFKSALILDKIPEGMKLYSTGDGSLKVSYVQELNTLTTSLEVEFVNNFISSTKIKSESTDKDGNKTVTEMNVNISLSCNVNYPDLTTYTLIN